MLLLNVVEKYKPVLKKILKGAFFVFVFFLAAVITYMALSLSKVFVKSEVPMNSKEVTNSISFDPNASYNILFLGYGGPGHDGGSLSDVLIVANVNPKEKHLNLISVPRDTWVELPIRSDLKEYHKINSAYAIGSDDLKYGLKEPQFRGKAGGGAMAKYAVSQVIGMPISYFVAVDFNGFKRAVDELEGVDVTVPVTFDDYYYPIKGAENLNCGKSGDEISSLTATMSGFLLEKEFGCRYEHLHFDKGIAHIDGETALKFVRSRHSDQHGGDFARSERQGAVLTGIKEKLLKLDAVSKWPEFFDRFVGMLSTDVDKNITKTIIESAGEIKQYSVSTIYLSTENIFQESKSSDGQYILVPKEGIGNWTEVHKFINQQISSN